MRYLLQRKLSLFLDCRAPYNGIIYWQRLGTSPLPPQKFVESKDADYIKWVDFNVPYEALDYSLKLHIESRNSEILSD